MNQASRSRKSPKSQQMMTVMTVKDTEFLEAAAKNSLLKDFEISQ